MTRDGPKVFRAEHVGSLIRPPELIEARHAVREGRLERAALAALEDRCVRQVVRMQEELGLEVVTDGEYRRGGFYSHFVKAVDGLTVKPAPYSFTNYEMDTAELIVPYAEGRLRRARGICTEEFRFASGLTARTVKVTMPSPPFINFLGGRERVDRAAYPDLEEYFADLAALYREEIAALASLGCTYVQLDEVPLAMMSDPRVRATVEGIGEDPERLVETYLETIAAALRDRPEGMRIAMHLCRGNYKGRWLAEGGYQAIAERLFQLPNIDLYLMEWDGPRAGDFAPLAHLPKGKTVALGLVTTKSDRVEAADEIKRRIEEAARFADLDQLALCPQCGFATNLTGGPITVEVEKAKLALVVEVARDVWG